MDRIVERINLHNKLQVVNTGESYIFGNTDTIKNGFIFVLEEERLVLISKKT